MEIQNEKYQKEKIVNSQYPNSRDPDGYLYCRVDDKTISNEERDDIWQLSYSAQIAEQSLILPSVDLSDKILLYVEETIAFDDIVSAPSSTLFFQGKKQLSYKGDYEVLVYDNGTKSIEVSKNSFIIYDTSSERAFKLKYLSYDDWILRFKYSEL